MADEQARGPDQGTTLRLELFVDTPLAQGSVHVALNRRSDLPDGHSLRTEAGERSGLGVEIVLEVDDVAAMCQHVAAQKWPLAAGLRRQPWGLNDFRVSDPDGYYWRVTSRRETATGP